MTLDELEERIDNLPQDSRFCAKEAVSIFIGVEANVASLKSEDRERFAHLLERLIHEGFKDVEDIDESS